MNSEQLIEYLQAVTMEILSTISAADMLDDASRLAAIRQIQNTLDQFGLTVQEVLPQEIIMSYFSGVEGANALLTGAGVSLATTTVFTPAGKIAQPFQKVIHLSAVERLVENTMDDMQAAIRTAKASVGINIEQTLAEVKKDLSVGLIRGDARNTTKLRVMKSFLDGGMTSFITKDNKRLPLNFYAATVARTKMREATVQGSVNRYKDTGSDLVQIVGNGDSCKTCSTYNGMVISLSGDTEGYPVLGENQIQLPPFHPNCRCSCRPFILRFVSAEEVRAAQKRNDKYEPGKDMRTKAERQAYEQEQKMRRIANEEQKQFMRWQEALGADAPKTLGAFRRMKRANSLKFQELQSNYRSLAMTKG